MVSIRFQQLILAVMICSYVNTATSPSEVPGLPVPPLATQSTNTEPTPSPALKNEPSPTKKTKKTKPQPRPLARRHPTISKSGVPQAMPILAKSSASNTTESPLNLPSMRAKLASIKTKVSSPPINQPITRRDPTMSKTGVSELPVVPAINSEGSALQSFKGRLADKLKPKQIGRRDPMFGAKGMEGGGTGTGLKDMLSKSGGGKIKSLLAKIGGAGGVGGAGGAGGGGGGASR